MSDAKNYIMTGQMNMVNKKKTILTAQDVDVLAERIRPYLTEKRYEHTLSVAKEAAILGDIYLPDEINRLKASALLHDITKRADFKKQLQYCQEFGIMVRTADKLSPSTFHAKTAAVMAEKDFPEYTDSEITAGVRWHTTGREGMTVFESIIYLADYIEETRDFDDCVKVRKYFYDRISCGEEPESVLTDTMIYSFDLTIDLLLKEGAIIDTDTVRARNYFIGKKKGIEQ